MNALIAALSLASLLAWLVMSFAELGRRFSVKGSVRRHRLTGIVWMSLWPALAHVVFTAATVVALDEATLPVAILCAVQLLAWAYTYHALKAAGDDHDFKDGGTRIRRRLSRMTSAPSAA